MEGLSDTPYFTVIGLVQMIDNSTLASELNPEPWYGNHWLYLIGLLIILVFVFKILFDIHFGVTKGKTGSKKPLPVQKRRPVFSIYYREPSSKSIQFRGKVIERRLKERGTNSKDLLAKIRRDYSYRVIDPNGIFLLASNHEKGQK
jgi:hypothetical protein